MRALLIRWGTFNAVGLMGVGVQLVALMTLKNWASLHYLPATALAVEAALLHNFIWHESWTWSDRRAGNRARTLARFLRFHLASGTVSIGGNLLFMYFLVGSFELHYVVANLITIASCSILNFVANDRFVFRAQETTH